MEPKNVKILVHPFHEFSDLNKQNQDKITKKVPKFVRGSKFLASYWGRQIKETAKNPKAIFVILVSWNTKEELKEVKKLIEFARRELGENLVVVPNNIEKITLTTEQIETMFELFEKKGIRISKNTEFHVFGEYGTFCVKSVEWYLKGEQLDSIYTRRDWERIDPKKVKVIEELCLDYSLSYEKYLKPRIRRKIRKMPKTRSGNKNKRK